MQTVSYGAFSQTIAHGSRGTRAPIKASFEVTRRCPLSCAHCYNNLPTGDRAARDAELSVAEHARILDELSALGCLWVTYTGGEIFARPDFLDIYREAIQRGFLVTLFTNATQITAAIADQLAARRPFRIEITLYGHTRATYERVTGISGSFERCRRGIDLLVERRLPVALKSVALTLNQHEIPDMQRFAAERALTFRYDALMNPRLDGAVNPLAVRLDPEATVRLDLTDPERAAELGSLAHRVTAASTAPPPSGQVYQCGGGVSGFAVDPYGGMSICVLSEVERFDLRQGPVSDGWEKFLRKVRARPISRTTKCTACRLRGLCGMCPATAQLENGDPEEPVDYLCQVAHLRALAVGPDTGHEAHPIPPHGDCEYCPGGARYQEMVARAARLREGRAASPTPAPTRRSLALAVENHPPSSCGSGHSCGAQDE